jgi:hypothetical protein
MAFDPYADDTEFYGPTIRRDKITDAARWRYQHLYVGRQIARISPLHRLRLRNALGCSR